MTRKELVKALEEKWGIKANYIGVPSCAYEIRLDTKTLQIDRHGVIIDEEGYEYSAESLLNSETLEAAKPIEEITASTDQYLVVLPLEDHTAVSLRNLINMIASKQHLLIDALGLEQPLLDINLAEELNKMPSDDLQSFQENWTKLTAQCSPGLVLDFTKQTLAIKMAKDNPAPEEIAAFMDLAACMNTSAKKLKRSSCKPTQEDNPKFALRTWLLRIGMNGDKHKMTRKVLLAKLSGNAAFRTAADVEKHKARRMDKKIQKSEVDNDVC